MKVSICHYGTLQIVFTDLELLSVKQNCIRKNENLSIQKILSSYTTAYAYIFFYSLLEVLAIIARIVVLDVAASCISSLSSIPV